MKCDLRNEEPKNGLIMAIYQLIYFPFIILELSGKKSAGKVGIPTLRWSNSGIAPIPTLRRT